MSRIHFVRRMELGLFALLIGIVLIPITALAATPTVTIRARTADQIVTAVLNASPTKNTVVLIEPGHYRFTKSFFYGFDADGSAVPAVKTSVFLIGTGTASNTILDAIEAEANHTRVLTVVKGGALSLRNVTVRGGGAGVVGGGGIGNLGGYLRLDDCVVTRNGAGDENGIDGGGILSQNGTLHVERTRVTDNVAENSGGGIAAFGGTIFIADSIISGNRSSSPISAVGGGLTIRSTGTIVRTTISDNSTSHRGGGMDVAGDISITDSAVVRNTALDEDEFRRSLGGGMATFGNIRLKNVTVADNTAGSFGGGIYNGGRLVLRGSSIVRNHGLGRLDPFDVGECQNAERGVCTGGGGIWNSDRFFGTVESVTSARSIIALNTIEVPPAGGYGVDCGGPMASEGLNSIGTLSGCTVRPSYLLGGKPTNDLIGDPRLDSLRDDGAAGNAHVPLLPGSPLVDAGGPLGNVCTVLDQIGQPRRDGNSDGLRRCDIGAIEFQPN